MAGMKNTIRRMSSASMGHGYRTADERRAAQKQRDKTKLDKVYSSAQIPDEEEIARNERRKAARRRGSRVSNVLTEDDTLG